MTEPTAELTPIPARPALAPWFRVVPDEDRLLLEHAGTVISFDGRAAGLLLPSLLPLLDGSRTVDDIVRRLGTAVAPATLRALELLGRKGALLDGPQPSRETGSGSEAAVFVASLGWASPAEALARLSRSRIAIGGRSGTARALVDVLAGQGVEELETVEIDHPAPRADLLIAAPTGDELAALSSLNERQLARNSPWLQVLPNDGRMVAIGPLFVPGTSACHLCYRIRRGAGSGFDEDFELVERTPPNAGSPSPLTTAAAGVAAILALRWLGDRDPTLPGRFYSLETGHVLGLDQHLVLRVPRCPACGTADIAMPSPWFDVKALDA